eukprot:scaffold47090_cov80-Phaeocystis_antarctica.AAC.1
MERRDATGRGERAAQLVRRCASGEVASGASVDGERADAVRAAQRAMSAESGGAAVSKRRERQV